jgi:quercetin dioxygenase-like cupin family protein
LEPAAVTFSFVHSTRQETPIVIPQIGLTLRVRVPPDTTGGVLTAIETINAPGFGPPLHRHRETEIFYVLEGRYLFEVDGRRFHAEAGDVVTAPGGSAHAFVNTTDKPARQFIQILPGLDAAAFCLGLGTVMRNGKPDQDALNAFGHQWQVEFLGPPLRADPRA